MAREWQPWEMERSGNKLNTYVLDNLLFFLKLHHTACRILVPQSGTELVPSALGAHSLNPCAIREVPDNLLSSSSYS